MLAKVGLILALCAPLAASATPPSPAAHAEIEHLLSYLERSNCEFYRNGNWYRAAAARSHIEKKYTYLLNKGQVANAEQFIERAASESSVSSKPYVVRCADATPIASSQWFTEELRRHRAAQAAQRK